jgi:hypothetical protein
MPCPQFMTTIDGLDIHFIHVRSRRPNALPVIITHGCPGSITEQLKIIGHGVATGDEPPPPWIRTPEATPGSCHRRALRFCLPL